MLRELSEAAKEELALALVLWKDFKSDGKMNLQAMTQAVELARYLGIEDQFSHMLAKVPPLKFVPLHP